MKKLLSVVLLLAAACTTASCNGNTAAQATTVTIEENPVATSGENALFQKQFEITDWTMEDLVSDMTVCGKKITLTCTITELSNVFAIEEFDHISGATGKQLKGCEIYHDGEKIAFAYCDIDNKPNTVTSICFDEFITGEMKIPEINIMGITEKSSAAEIVEILGQPNVDSDFGCDYRYYFSDNRYLYISFNKEKTNIEYIAVVFN